MSVSIPTALSSLLICFASRILTPRHRFRSNPCSSTSTIWCLQTPKRRPPPTAVSNAYLNPNSVAAKLAQATTSGCSKPNEFTEFDNIDYSLLPDPMARRKIAPAGKVAISSASAPLVNNLRLRLCLRFRRAQWPGTRTPGHGFPDTHSVDIRPTCSALQLRNPLVLSPSSPGAPSPSVPKAPPQQCGGLLSCGRMQWPCTNTDRWLCLRNAATNGCLRIQRPELVGALNAAALASSSSSSSNSGSGSSSSSSTNCAYKWCQQH